MKVKVFSGRYLERDINIWLESDINLRIESFNQTSTNGKTTITIIYEITNNE